MADNVKNLTNCCVLTVDTMTSEEMHSLDTTVNDNNEIYHLSSEQTLQSLLPEITMEDKQQYTYLNPGNFRVDKESIPSVPVDQQNDELKNLDICAYDQTQFELEVMGQVDQALKYEEEKRHKLRAEKEIKSIAVEIRSTKVQLSHLDKTLATSEDRVTDDKSQRQKAAFEKERKIRQLRKLESKERKLNAFIAGNAEKDGQEDDDSDSDFQFQEMLQSDETEEEKLIRTGHMTPFGTIIQKIAQPETSTDVPPNSFGRFLFDGAQLHASKRKRMKDKPLQSQQKTPLGNVDAHHEDVAPGSVEDSQPCLDPSTGSWSPSSRQGKPLRHSKKMKLGTKYATGTRAKRHRPKLNQNFGSDPDMSDFENGDEVSCDEQSCSDEDYVPDVFPSGSSDELNATGVGGRKKKRPQKLVTDAVSRKLKKSPSKEQTKVVDDGLVEAYTKRMKIYRKSKLEQKYKKILESDDGIVQSDDEDCEEFDGNFKVPNCVWNKLYSYQQTGVRWLWELHQQNCGGIVGDEMGLGKTIEVIAFFIGLKVSNQTTAGDLHQGLGPVLLVCPATVMHQWVKEFHTWWPPFRIAILHESGSFTGKKEQLVRNIHQGSGIIVTSYNGLVQHQESLLSRNWHYIVLDEGHKIRNPDSKATLVAKQFCTSHRLILSGSPVQNNLKELWSLFDFVFPGKLGTLPIFMQQFSVPIVQGGYANASQVQVQTAYKCATVLRDTIKPYLLRRMKTDVKMSINLPNKSEQVLFCKLTEEQTDLYKGYIASSEVQSILNARLKVFIGLINLRKICNHPDLYTGGPKIFKHTDVSALSDDMQYGFFPRSGKMIVVEALLKLWHKQSHRVLLFTQSRQMMEILEIFVKKQGYSYMKMDGTTAVSARQPAIAKFNGDPSIFVFLLTTRVGGIGVNLTGANRIIIYDPDWNPSTDAQARERSWRIGQTRQVTIYRLLTTGTIEEKIYHRQIFKQFVTNRVLKDPRQRRFFKSNDLYELFSFTEMGKQGTETSAIFAGTGSEIKPVTKLNSNCPKGKGFWRPSTTDIKSSFSSEKVEKMKELAKKLSQQLLQKASSSNDPASPSTSKLHSKSDNEFKSVENGFNDALGDQTDELAGSSRSSERDKLKLKENKQKHRKRKKNHPTVDGEQIDYLVKKATYKVAEQEEKEKDSAKDDYVLSKLFKKSGVHSALKHDAIVNSSDPDYMLVEGEANKVAQDAVKALRHSRRDCARAIEGIPTWTGANGGMQRRFGSKTKLPKTSLTKTTASTSSTSNSTPSTSGFTAKKISTSTNAVQSPNAEASASSSLLNVIRQRKEHFANARSSDGSDSERDEAPVQWTNSAEYDELLVDIRNFIAFGASVDGQATTEELLDKFRDKLPTEHTAVFKSLLNKICDFSRNRCGDGIWYLKEEFR